MPPTKILGLSWKRISNEEDPETENKPKSTKSTEHRSKSNSLALALTDRGNVIRRTLRRVQSVRDAFDTVKQVGVLD